MDLDWSDQDREFQDEVRAFLDKELTPDLRAADRGAPRTPSRTRHRRGAWRRGSRAPALDARDPFCAFESRQIAKDFDQLGVFLGRDDGRVPRDRNGRLAVFRILYCRRCRLCAGSLSRLGADAVIFGAVLQREITPGVR